MECVTCGEKAVFAQPALCKEHFCRHVEDVVKDTIERHGLCSKEDRVCVAVSGGKDSLTVLHILHVLGYHVEALAVDEGIDGYREHSLCDLRPFCEDRSIPLQVVSFQEEVGKPLDAMVEGKHPCSVCGVFRRFLLNKHAKGYSLIATGHNLDDEAQAVLMNLAKANKDLLHRSHLRTPLAEGFVPRIKPLAFLTEKEVLAYAFLMGFSSTFVECPYAHLSFRSRVRDVLNEYETAHPGMKQSLLDAALRVAVTGTGSFVACPTCGEPSANGVCRACALRSEFLGGAA